MRWIVWAIRLLIFVIVLAFAIKNTAPVRIQLFFGWEWDLPLVVLLLIVFIIGAMIGVVSTMGNIWRSSREISRLKRQVRHQQAVHQMHVPVDQVKSDALEG